MIINVNLKQIGSKKPTIAKIPFDYATSPQTVQELIAQTVTICVAQYNERIRQGTGDENIKPLTSRQITDMAEVGKIAFGINYGGKAQELAKKYNLSGNLFNGFENVDVDNYTLPTDGDFAQIKKNGTIVVGYTIFAPMNYIAA